MLKSQNFCPVFGAEVSGLSGLNDSVMYYKAARTCQLVSISGLVQTSLYHPEQLIWTPMFVHSSCKHLNKEPKLGAWTTESFSTLSVETAQTGQLNWVIKVWKCIHLKMPKVRLGWAYIEHLRLYGLYLAFSELEARNPYEIKFLLHCSSTEISLSFLSAFLS